MTEQWQELKETITEMRDNNGTGTQQDVCKFLANLMDVLEKQMQEPCEDAISRQAVLNILQDYVFEEDEIESVTDECQNNMAESIARNIVQLPPVNPQEPKTGHWIYKMLKGQFCSICDEQSVWKFNYCPNCGAKMEVSE